jgi:hypothetical protein
MLLIDAVHGITEASLYFVISSQLEALHVQNSYKECFHRMEHSCPVEMSESVMRFVVSTYLNFCSFVMHPKQFFVPVGRAYAFILFLCCSNLILFCLRIFLV